VGDHVAADGEGQGVEALEGGAGGGEKISFRF